MMIHTNGLVSIISMTILCLLYLSVGFTYASDVVLNFNDIFSNNLNHLVIDSRTKNVYIGAVNRIYEVSENLDIINTVSTGPVANCTANCSNKRTDNVNKALLIDYATNRLITCGSVEGVCSARDLNNISKVLHESNEPVVASDDEASAVAFIASGPTANSVMYVGASSPARFSDVIIPTISSRSLADDNLFAIAHTEDASGTKMYVNSVFRQRYPINYVYGFSSEGFSYFLTTQLRRRRSNFFYSKLVRVCQNDENYHSYTEIPITCTGEGNVDYNLVQAAYKGKAGSTLADKMGISIQDDVLYAVFSSSKADDLSLPSDQSALCIFSLKDIRRKFMQNIQNCFHGNGVSGLEFISPTTPCIRVPYTVGEDFCGLDVNTPLGGDQPIEAAPVAVFNKRLTAVAATVIEHHTIVFAGTLDGHLKKVHVKSATTAYEYGDVIIDNGSPINRDMLFDSQGTHLYVMSKTKVSKVKVWNCDKHASCSSCVEIKDPYCGWCSTENKCSIQSECYVDNSKYWRQNILDNRHDACAVITRVSPPQLQRTIITTLKLYIDNLSVDNEELFCSFAVSNYAVITNATKKSYGVDCRTPYVDSSPDIPIGEHYIITELAVRNANTFIGTNFTLFDCNSYSTCTECVNSPFSCDWCMDSHRCILQSTEHCNNDAVITNANRLVSSNQNSKSCLAIHSKSNEILIPSGVQKAIKVSVSGQIGQKKLICKFVMNGMITKVNAHLLDNTVYCDSLEFKYTSTAANVTASFDVLGDDKPLDNPENIHVVIYKCERLASDCGTCLTLAQGLNCGWCHGTETCSLRDQCTSNVWFHQTHTCPNPTIHSFTPMSGPLEGGTKVVIIGTNLGRSISENAITIAGAKCEPIPEEFIKTKKILCTVQEANKDRREGPVVIHVGDYRAESKNKFTFVDPKIDSFDPKLGSLSGGTTLQISGEYLSTGSKVQVFIDEIPCIIKQLTNENIVCETGRSEQLGMGTVRVIIDNALRSFEPEKFAYVEDPVVMTIESGITGPRQAKGTPSGGSSIKVIGHFQGVQFPRIYVTNNGRSFDAYCHKVDNTLLICESPVIEGHFNVEADRPMELQYGFYMDNVESVKDLKEKTGAFLLYPDPVYEKFDEDIKHHNADYLTINGQNIDSAWSSDDVEVRVGDKKCNVTSLSRHQLTCRLPSKGDLSAGEDSFQVVVRVGNLTFKIGRITFS